MNTFLGATATFSTEQLSEEALKYSEFLYIEGYLVASPTGREASILARSMARKHHVKTAISLSDPNMVTYFRYGLQEIIDGQVDILFCNEVEAKLFTESDDIEQAKELLREYANKFIITLGGRGCLLYDGNNFTHIKPYKTNVIDTVGAGDVYAGAFLYGVTHGYDYVTCADLANYAASKVVAKFGPRLSGNEIEEVCARIPRQQLAAKS